MTQITEINVVDSYYDLDIASIYKHDPKRIANGMSHVFANFGLEFVDVGSEAYKCVRRRYTRVLDQIRSNKRNAKARYNNFDHEKLLFSSAEFPKLCADKSTTTR